MIYKQLDGNIGELKFYGNISEWWISGEDFTRTIEEMATKFVTIHIRAHCYGGSVFEGNVMYNAILRCKPNVILYIDGVAASMMAIVMQACDEVIIAENGWVMVHAPRGCVHGTSKELFQSYKLLLGMEKNFTKTLSRKTGKAEKEVAKWLDGSDYWFDADEAKAEGLVTSIQQPVVANIVSLDKPSGDGQEESIYDLYAALLDNPTAQVLKPNDNSMKKELIAQFNLTGVTENSTDAEIQAALKAKINGEQVANRKESVEAIIAGHERLTQKPFEASYRANLAAIGEQMGIAFLQTTMTGVVVTAPTSETTQQIPNGTQTNQIPNVVSLISGEGKGALTAQIEARKAWGWEDWQKNDAKGLAALEDSNRELFTALYNAEFGKPPIFF